LAPKSRRSARRRKSANIIWRLLSGIAYRLHFCEKSKDSKKLKQKIIALRDAKKCDSLNKITTKLLWLFLRYKISTVYLLDVYNCEGFALQVALTIRGCSHRRGIQYIYRFMQRCGAISSTDCCTTATLISQPARLEPIPSLAAVVADVQRHGISMDKLRQWLTGRRVNLRFDYHVYPLANKQQASLAQPYIM